MRYDLIIFDCDGVLVDSEVLAIRAMTKVVNEAGVPVTQEMIGGCFGMKQADILLKISELAAMDIPEGVPQRIWPATRDLFGRELKPMPGAREFVQSCAGLKSCVASSSSPERIAFSLGVTGLAGCFGDRVFSSHQVARGKPAPDLFLYAAASMGVAPARAVVIEDSVFGIEGARAAGMTAIGFDGGSHVGAGHDALLLSAGAATVERDWAALADLVLR